MGPVSPYNLILGSASPRRKELLGHLGLPFQILTADIDEDIPSSGPEALVRELARLKGQACLERARAGLANPLVVSADTTVALHGQVYNKPLDRQDAGRMLLQLSGHVHDVFTGVAITTLHKQYVFAVRSQVTFDPISPEILETYLATGDSLDKAGAYGIQGPSLTFISKVEGSYSNVVGLPLSDLVRELKSFLGGSDWRRSFLGA